MENDKIKWYQKKEIWGLSLFVTGGVRYIAKPYTLAYQIADYSFTVGIPLLLTYLGVKDGYKNDTLPSGLSKIFKKKNELFK